MNSIFSFTPARLVKGKTRWDILFYQTRPGESNKTRFRLTFDLNRIYNLKDREKRGLFIVKVLNASLLQEGYPFLSPEYIQSVFKAAMYPENDNRPKLPLNEAIALARDIKCTSDREFSNKGYRSMYRIFLKWAEQLGIENMSVCQFDSIFAIRFMDHCLLNRNVSNNTYNNYLAAIRIMFKELKIRGYVDDNPFDNIPKKKAQPKKRRNFDEYEKKAVLKAVKEDDIWLFRALLLMYTGFLRTTELRRLKFANFDLGKGVINLSPEQTKNWYPKTVTLPKQILPYFLNPEFAKYPANYFVFGTGLKPHPREECGKHALYRKHERILKQLLKKGHLQDISGLTWYSWKDTGMTDATDSINLKDVQTQAGHQSIEETMRYVHPHQLNEGMRNYRQDLFDNL